MEIENVPKVPQVPQLLIDAEKLFAGNDDAGLRNLKRGFLQDFVLKKFPDAGSFGTDGAQKEAERMLTLLNREKGELFNRIPNVPLSQFPDMTCSQNSFVEPELALMEFINGIEIEDIHQAAIDNIGLLNGEMYDAQEFAFPSHIARKKYWEGIENISRIGMGIEELSTRTALDERAIK